MPSKNNETNAATREILKFLLRSGVFAWRNNVLPVFDKQGGLRPGSKGGLPDICGIYGGRGFSYKNSSTSGVGIWFGVEVKRGSDRLRPVQIGFHTQARKLGAIIITASGETAVEIYNDFEKQWKQITTQK